MTSRLADMGTHAIHSPLFSAPLHPFPATDLLMVEFALDVRSDPEFGAVPEAIHFLSEVLGELG